MIQLKKQHKEVVFDDDGIPMPEGFDVQIDKSDFKIIGSRMVARGQMDDLFQVFVEILSERKTEDWPEPDAE